MQAAKDSFYMALRERLAALNPARTVVVDGDTRPGIMVRENAEPQFTEAQTGVFYLDWGELQVAESTRPILGLSCEIWYASSGSTGTGVDRGRLLAEMDSELVQICKPPYTAMMDYTQSPSVALGSGLFWTMPALKTMPGTEAVRNQDRGTGSGQLERSAQLRIYFFLPEVEA